MAVYKDPKPTKNGRAWYFKFSYKDAFGATKQYRSKRYLTKKEASDAERMFLVTSTDKVEDNNMTFKDLYDEFRMHNDEIMKATTLCGYSYKEKYIECFFPVKIKDFNIMQFEQWKREINKLNISLRYKNDCLIIREDNKRGKDGLYCVLEKDNDYATIRKLININDGIMVMPLNLNGEFKPKTYLKGTLEFESLRILGPVVQVKRYYD